MSRRHRRRRYRETQEAVLDEREARYASGRESKGGCGWDASDDDDEDEDDDDMAARRRRAFRYGDRWNDEAVYVRHGRIKGVQSTVDALAARIDALEKLIVADRGNLAARTAALRSRRL
jgi:quinol monooxygenase YgiN